MNRNMRDRVEALEARLLPPPAARVFFIVIEDQSPLTSDEPLAAFRAESAVVVDALLALEPEELGARMLFLIRSRPDAAPFNLSTLRGELWTKLVAAKPSAPAYNPCRLLLDCQNDIGCCTTSSKSFWSSMISVRMPPRVSHHRSGSKLE